MGTRLLVLLTLIFLSACSEKKTHVYTELPVPPKAFSITHYKDRPAKGAVALTYTVKTTFPAEDLVAFTDNEMKAKGFKRYPMPGSLPSFAWSALNPETGNWGKTDRIPARYAASWVNEKRDEIAWIVIDYAPSAQAENWQDTARVSFQIDNLASFQRAMKALDRVHKLQQGN